MRVCHVINCLSVGGTERQLVRLVAARSAAIDPLVVTLLSRDTLRGEVEAAGVRVRCVGLDAARPTPAALARLAGILREERPDVVQSWLYHANAATALARPFAGGRWPLAWNVRQTVGSLDGESRSMRLAFRLNRWLAPRVEVLVSNSRRSLDDHRRLGLRARREVVIPNGFDLAAVAHGAAARQAARGALGLAADTLVVGIVGRDHPVKDHAGFLEAMAGVSARSARPVLALMIGRGVDGRHELLNASIQRLGLKERVQLLGERLDLASLYAAFDCLVSSSRGEAFPNVVAEAMAAGVPVVATDVGECRDVVGEAGAIVPPGDPEQLAAAIDAMLSLPHEERLRLGEQGRRSVQDRFGMAGVAEAYERLWRELEGARGK